MKIYTVLDNTDPASLRQFAQTCKDCGATGVTIFTRPDPVAAPLDGQTAKELQAQADAAAARKDYATAARLQEQVSAVHVSTVKKAKDAAKWMEEALEPVLKITQVVALGDLHWPGEAPLTAENFLAHAERISTTLLTTGIGGIVHKTPLSRRTFIPLAPAPTGTAPTPVAGGSATQGEPAGGPHSVPVESPSRPAWVPKDLPENQFKYLSFRLGLDRGGLRRSKQEAGNLMGWSPTLAAKLESAIGKAAPEFLARVTENTPEISK